MYWTKFLFVLLPFVNVKAADDYIGTNRRWDNGQTATPVHRVPRPVPRPIEIGPVESTSSTVSSTTEAAYVSYTTAPRARLTLRSRQETTTPQTKWISETTSPRVTYSPTTEPPQIILIKESEPEEIPTISAPVATSSSPVSSYSYEVEPKPEEIKVVNISQEPSSSVVDLSTLAATASPASTVFVVLLNGDSEKPDLKTNKDSNMKVIMVTTPQPPTGYIETSPSYIELPSHQEPTQVQKDVSRTPSEPVTLIASRPLPSWESTMKPQPIQTVPPPLPPITEPVIIRENEAEEESRLLPAPAETSTYRIIKIVQPREEVAKPKPLVNEPVIVPTNRRPISLPNRRPIPEIPKIVVAPEPEIIAEPKPTSSPVEPIIVYQPTPAPATAPPASNIIVYRPSQSWESTNKPITAQTAPPPPAPTTPPTLIWEIEPEVESRPPPAPVEPSTPRGFKIVLPREEATKPKPLVNEPVVVPTNRRPISVPNSRSEPEEPKIFVAPKPEAVVEPKPAPTPVEPIVVYQPTPAPTPAPPATKVVEYRPQPVPAPTKPEPIYIEQRPKPTPAPVAPTKPSINNRNSLPPPSPTTKSPTQLFDYNCRDANGFYGVANDCDSYVECKKHVASMFTCPEGLHYNPKAIWPEFPCGYPWEVQCESNALKQQPMPTSDCPHQYGYFALAGDCGKYVMCQEGRAIVMNCPPGLAFNVATSSCDWPENVPSCNPSVFGGFTCPAPPTDAYGAPLDLISKYRYGKSCREYVACQHGRPRLLSCDPGFSFDEDFQVCIDSDFVQNCMS